MVNVVFNLRSGMDRGAVMDLLGFIPGFLNLDDPRGAVAQLGANYAHGGGWRPMQGFTADPDCTLHYPGDPPLVPVAMIPFRDEAVIIYQYSWVAVFQKDHSFEVCRMD